MLMDQMRPEIAAGLTGTQRAAVARLDNWNLDFPTRRAQARMGWSSEHAQAVSCEYRKFLALMVLNPHKPYGMAGPVDEVWHDHILFSPDYVALCHQVAGHYLHHVPHESVEDGADKIDHYGTHTVADLAATFSTTNGMIWPDPDMSGLARKCGGDKCCGGHVADGVTPYPLGRSHDHSFEQAGL